MKQSTESLQIAPCGEALCTAGLTVSAEMTEMLQEAKNLVDLPALGKGDAMLINDTVRENLFVCQPQHQNMHGRIFGGFLMRWAGTLF